MTTTQRFIQLLKPSINSEDMEAVNKSLQSSMITRGPLVAAFEEAIAKYCDAKYAVAFNSGTSALMAAYNAADLSPNDFVFSSANTFIATVGAPLKIKSKVTFIDIDTNTGSFDIRHLKENINPRMSKGKVIITPIHFAGIPIDMQYIDKSISGIQTILIEDAAHALGSVYPSGEKVGSCAYSHMTMFSFHPAKNITTGEGGMITTNDPILYQKLRKFRDNGIERIKDGWNYPPHETSPWYYEVQEITGNYHMTEMQAALGLSQLNRLDLFIKRRRELVQLYRSLLSNVPNIRLLTDLYDDLTAFHLFVVQIDFTKYHTTRGKVMEALKQLGIATQVHYIPLYEHPLIKNGLNNDVQLGQYFPETESYYKSALTLPLHYELSDEDIKFVCASLIKVLN